MDFLTKEGKQILKQILEHCKDLELEGDNIDPYESAMLANTYDMYIKACVDIRKNGATQVTQSGYSQINAQYTIMKNSYDTIIKHSPKFGMTPMDKQKILEGRAPKEDGYAFQDFT